jgi:diaminopimelate epimerase
MKLTKYHALGNDYLVLQPMGDEPAPVPDQIRLLCHRHFGVGGDGLLYGPLPAPGGGLSVRIFNPDGSEAEKSGNGLRIFARFLWDGGLIGRAPVVVQTAGGPVTVEVLDEGHRVRVAMGRVSFASGDVPATGPSREILEEPLIVAGETLACSAVSLGNPHCVIFYDGDGTEAARRLGPLVEGHPLFPRRANVQFVRVFDPANLALAIWERGAGMTLASGSSACAAVAVARRLGRCAAQVRVHMPGGALDVAIDADFCATLEGPVTRIAAIRVDDALLDDEETRSP